jgi:hypothetical protein
MSAAVGSIEDIRPMVNLLAMISQLTLLRCLMIKPSMINGITILLQLNNNNNCQLGFKKSQKNTEKLVSS